MRPRSGSIFRISTSMMSPTLSTVPCGMLGLVQQAILLDADVHEGAEVHHVADGAFERHANQQVFHLEHIRAQDGRGGIGTRVTPRADELLEDVFQRGQAAAQFGGQFLGRDFGGQRLEGGFALS